MALTDGTMTNEADDAANEVTKQGAPVHVRQIVIEGLFGEYTHRIPLAEKGGVVILHGRNGVGKTITLRMIKALLSGLRDEIRSLKRWPFDKVRIEFSDNTFLELRQRRVVPKPEDSLGKTGRNNAGAQRQLEMACTNWPYSFAELTFALDDGFLSPYFSLADRVKVHFVDIHRLGTETTGDVAVYPVLLTAMVRIRGEIVDRINAVDAKYREISSALDDSFATRLFASPASVSIDSLDLEKRYEALERERARLRDIGLLADSKSSFHPTNLDPTKQAMFAVYLEDNEKKLAVFKDLADRAEILLNALNSKLAPKRIRLDSSQGYRVDSHNDQPLDMDWLSSGEQHQFVLLHNLLFNVAPGSLLLIDEPELSLHVTWQNEFLADLVRIAQRIGFDAIVATHSPYIVGSRRDLLVQLGAPE